MVSFIQFIRPIISMLRLYGFDRTKPFIVYRLRRQQHEYASFIVYRLSSSRKRFRILKLVVAPLRTPSIH